MIIETIDSEYERNSKWCCGIVKGNDNCFFCLPFGAKYVLTINSSNDETTLAGEENNDYRQWCNGFAQTDFSYGISYRCNKLLKYNTKTEISELVCDGLVDDYYGKWMSGAVADDGSLYCFPFNHKRILQFNPNGDTTIFVGKKIERVCKFSGIIKAKNECMYSILSSVSRVAKFYVATQNVTFIDDGLNRLVVSKRWMKIFTVFRVNIINC